MCESMFVNCTKLKKLNNIRPTVRLTCTANGGSGPFYGCSNLETKLYLADAIYLNNRTEGSTIRVQLFRKIGSPEIWIPKSISSISASYVFYDSTRLKSLVIPAEVLVSISNSNALVGMPSTTNIYVPDELVSSYKAASYWSARASHIYPMSEYTV